MNTRSKDRLLLCSAIALGLGVSTGYPLGMIAAAGMPLACLAPGTRKAAFKSAFGYYAAALWPMIPGLEAYLEIRSLLSLFCFGSLLRSCFRCLGPIAWTSRSRPLLVASAARAAGNNRPAARDCRTCFSAHGSRISVSRSGWIGLAAVALLPGIILSTQSLSLRRRCVVL